MIEGKGHEIIRRVMHELNRIDGVYYIYSKKTGINENMLTVLYALDDGNAHSQKDICEEWLIPKTTISSVIRGLENDGYVSLMSAEHTKEKTIVLTKKGKAFVSEILKDIYKAERTAMDAALEKYPDFVDAITEFTERLSGEFDKLI